MVLFVVVDGDEDCAVVGQEFFEEVEAGPHHAEPFVVAFQVLAVHGAVLAEPFAHQGAVDLVVVDPAFVAGVVGRVDVDAFDAAGVAGEEGFEGVEVVAVDDEVVVGVGVAGGVEGSGGVGNQGAVGDGEVVGVDVLFALEVEGGHWRVPPGGRVGGG